MERKSPHSINGRIGAELSGARTNDRSARMRAAREKFLQRFEREVDPDGKLPPDERRRRAEHAKRANMLRLAKEQWQAARPVDSSAFPLRTTTMSALDPWCPTWHMPMTITFGPPEPARLRREPHLRSGRRGLSLRGATAVTGTSPTVRQRELGKRLRELRSRHDLTVEDVAQKFLCSATKVSRLETGARRPSLRDRQSGFVHRLGTGRGGHYMLVNVLHVRVVADRGLRSERTVVPAPEPAATPGDAPATLNWKA